jgi:hypothetical protein
LRNVVEHWLSGYQSLLRFYFTNDALGLTVVVGSFSTDSLSLHRSRISRRRLSNPSSDRFAWIGSNVNPVVRSAHSWTESSLDARGILAQFHTRITSCAVTLLIVSWTFTAAKLRSSSFRFFTRETSLTHHYREELVSHEMRHRFRKYVHHNFLFPRLLSIAVPALAFPHSATPGPQIASLFIYARAAIKCHQLRALVKHT